MKTISFAHLEDFEFFTADVLAELLGVSESTVYRRAGTLRQRGQLHDKRCTWTPDQARHISEFIVDSGYLKGKVRIT